MGMDVQAREEILSRLSHELRTPLNAVIGFWPELRGSRARALGGAQSCRIHELPADDGEPARGWVAICPAFPVLRATGTEFPILRTVAGDGRTDAPSPWTSGLRRDDATWSVEAGSVCTGGWR